MALLTASASLWTSWKLKPSLTVFTVSVCSVVVTGCSITSWIGGGGVGSSYCMD